MGRKKNARNSKMVELAKFSYGGFQLYVLLPFIYIFSFLTTLDTTFYTLLQLMLEEERVGRPKGGEEALRQITSEHLGLPLPSAQSDVILFRNKISLGQSSLDFFSVGTTFCFCCCCFGFMRNLRVLAVTVNPCWTPAISNLPVST